MDPKKLATIIVAVIVGVILTSAILVPIVSDHTSAQKTVTNEGSYFTTPDENEHTIIIQHGQITYDGELCVWPNLALYGSATIMCGADWMLRVDSGTNPATDSLRYVFAGPPHAWNVLGSINPATDDALTITISGSAVTATLGSTSFSKTGLAYTIAPTGNYVMCNKPYLLDDTEIVAPIRNNNNAANTDTFEIVKGTIGDISNMSATVCRNLNALQNPQNGDIVSSTFTADTTTVEGDLLKLNKITQTATMWFDPTETYGNVATFTITYVIVPETITYDNPNYVGNNLSSMLNIIPIIVIMGLVVGLAAAFFAGRNDY